jgi:hypothetical protein
MVFDEITGLRAFSGYGSGGRVKGSAGFVMTFGDPLAAIVEATVIAVNVVKNSLRFILKKYHKELAGNKNFRRSAALVLQFAPGTIFDSSDD